jgi:hypothetical protein
MSSPGFSPIGLFGSNFYVLCLETYCKESKRIG